MHPYPYQQKGIENIRKFFKSNKLVIYQLPTGGGKTVVFSFNAKLAMQAGSRILIISHRIELLTQAGGTLKEFGLNPFLITSKTKVLRDSKIYVAMTGTLKNRIKKWVDFLPSIDMIIIDECHRSEFSWINDYFKGYKLGVTATPKRSGKMPQLGDEYKGIINGPDVQELINMNKLVYDRYFGVPVDMSGVGKDMKGEYNNHQMYEKYNKTTLYQGVVNNWKKHCPDTITLCFCVNIQHAIKTTEQFVNAGIEAKFVTSAPVKPKQPKVDDKAAWTRYKRKLEEYNYWKVRYNFLSGPRDKVISDWKDGKYKILVNAGVLVEGFDHKPTQTVIVNLATTSENKWLQMLGRGSRIFPGKEYFNILDFGENADRLGHYRQQRTYSLWHTERKGDGVPASKECLKCKALVLASSKMSSYVNKGGGLVMDQVLQDEIHLHA
jgi:superfamily II DNA or RNA helicase